MKPDWKDAPEWARYLAMDAYGHWWWFAEAAELLDYGWNSSSSIVLSGVSTDWRDTLEERPKAAP